jgi:hypothetical protein
MNLGAKLMEIKISQNVTKLETEKKHWGSTTKQLLLALA